MKIGAGFALALAFLAAIGTVAYRSIGKLTETAGWVDHTQQVLIETEAVRYTMTNAETGQRGYILTGKDSYIEPYRAARDAISASLSSLRSLTQDNPEEQRQLDLLDPLINGRDGKFAELQEVIDARNDPSRGFDGALKILMTDKGKNSMDDIRKVLDTMKATETALLKVRTDEAQASARDASLVIIWGSAAAFLILAAIGFVVTRNIAGPLQELTGASRRIAEGDLRGVSLTLDRQDEVGLLSVSFSRMTDSLKSMAEAAGRIASGDLRTRVEPQSERDLLGTAFASMVDNLRRLSIDVAEGVNVLGAAANEISASTSQFAASTAESATAVSETSTTVEEVRQTAQMASQKARSVAESAQKAAQFSEEGRRSSEAAVAGTVRIRQQMESIAAGMMRLNEQSQAIGQIIASVEDLAAQSNLLAVNAAIEAAKAGEHGRGFAVVAQEVKSLAEQSRQATTQVRTILADIQKAAGSAALATEQGTKAVEAGARQSEAAGESVQSLAASVSEAAQASTQIAASSQQQLAGVDQVASAMESIRQATTQNVASAKQLEVSARNLSDLGQKLKDLVARYRI
ncbi:MAG TPA: CHASE3 domain-containing protein [Opitutaceae bacterium]|jgi:methyl-accepting chemotaxis protein